LPTLLGDQGSPKAEAVQAMAGSPDAAVLSRHARQRLAVLLWLSDRPNTMKDMIDV